MGWDPNKPGMQRVWRRTGRDRDAPRRKSEAYGGLLTCCEQGSAEAEGVLVLMGPAVRVGTRGVGGAELSAPQCVPAEPYPADGLCSEMPLFLHCGIPKPICWCLPPPSQRHAAFVVSLPFPHGKQTPNKHVLGGRTSAEQLQSTAAVNQGPVKCDLSK